MTAAQSNTTLLWDNGAPRPLAVFMALLEFPEVVLKLFLMEKSARFAPTRMNLVGHAIDGA